jgi:type I restriction enzyme S subunit
MVLRAKPETVLQEFLPFFMLSETFWERAIAISVGSLSPTINWKALARQEFLIPPKVQQAKLAEVLWAADDVTNSAATLVDTLRDSTKTTLTRKLLSDGQEWKEVKLGDLVKIVTGKLDSNAASEDGVYPFFTCDPVTLRIDDFSFDCEALLLAGNNAAGVFPLKYYKGKFDAYQRTYVITITDEDLIHYPYLLESMRMRLDLLRRLSVGSSTKFLTMKVLNNIGIPLPPLKVQNETVSIANDFRASIDEATKTSATSLRVRSSLINQIF